MATGKGMVMAAGIAAGGVLIIVAAVLLRKPSNEPVPQPPPRVHNAARIKDEGSLTRQSPEEEFLSVVSKTAPVKPMSLDAQKAPEESSRVLGGLRSIFSKMKALADAYKKTDPERYAAGMEALKDELAALMQAAKTLFKESEAAVQELFKAIREEADPLIKERMAFLLRFVDPAKAGPFARELGESALAADRKAAIGYLQEMRTPESSEALRRRAEADPDMELRQRAIVGLGKQLSGMSPQSEQFWAANLDALRRYVQPGNEAPIRAAAWDAFTYPPVLPEEDKTRIRDALRAEQDPAVLKSVRNAFRHLNVREKAEADRLNPKTPAPAR